MSLLLEAMNFRVRKICIAADEVEEEGIQWELKKQRVAEAITQYDGLRVCWSVTWYRDDHQDYSYRHILKN